MSRKGFTGIEILVGVAVLGIIIAATYLATHRPKINSLPTPTPTIEVTIPPEETPTATLTSEPTITPVESALTPTTKVYKPNTPTLSPTPIPTTAPTILLTTVQPTTIPPTSTPIPPTATPIPVPTPTNTPIPTNTPTPTDTPTPTATNTPVPTCPVCSAPNVTTYGCYLGSCTIGACNAYYGDCDGAFGDGCEMNIGNNVNNCGSCGHVCDLPNVNVHSCNTGTCGIVSCDQDWIDVNHNPTDGCEVHAQ